MLFAIKFCLFLFCYCTVVAQQKDTIQTTLCAKLLPQMQQHKLPGLAVAIVAKGKVAWRGSVGVQEAGTNTPLTAHTRFQIASISKAVTALLVMRLAHQLKLDLNADINAGLINWKLPPSKYATGTTITPTLLLQHRGGINFDGSWGYVRNTTPLPTLLDLLNGVHTHQGEGPIRSIAFPKQKFLYSSGGYALLEQWLTDTQQQTFEQLLQQELFKPLWMVDATSLPVLQLDIPDGYASGHSEKGRVIDGKLYYYPFAAGAGIYASIDDMARLAVGVLDAYAGRDTTWLSKKDVLKLAMLPTGDGGDYALGWHVERNAKGELSIYHRGLNRGFISIIKIDLDNDSAGIVLTNSEGGSKLWQPAIAALKEILFSKGSL